MGISPENIAQLKGKGRDTSRSTRGKVRQPRSSLVPISVSITAPHCICCMQPRSPRSFPICGKCSSKNRK